jgi:hypothetical protein
LINSRNRPGAVKKSGTGIYNKNGMPGFGMPFGSVKIASAWGTKPRRSLFDFVRCRVSPGSDSHGSEATCASQQHVHQSRTAFRDRAAAATAIASASAPPTPTAVVRSLVAASAAATIAAVSTVVSLPRAKAGSKSAGRKTQKASKNYYRELSNQFLH